MVQKSTEAVSFAWRFHWWVGLARDGLRGLWALVYWNARKAWYQARGRRGRAPCQHGDDVADGVQPRCDACWNWAGPGRFHRVCPALVRTPEGWRCSAAPAAVRPYWGRALGVYALLIAGLYIGATGVLWLGWQRVGYREIAYADVVWPGRWSQVKVRQAEHFRRQAAREMEDGDFSAALLSLTTAERFARGGYDDRLLLARFWAHVGNVGYGEEIVRGVMRDFPERAGATAVVWHDQLLASGQLAALADLCAYRLGEAGADAPESLWEFSLGFALDHGRLAAAMAKGRRGELARLPARIRGFITVLEAWQAGDERTAGDLLAAMRFTAAEPLAIRRQVEWLARLGRTGDAGVVLNLHAAALGTFETAALRCEIDQASGDRDARRADFIGLLKGPLTPAQAGRLCGLVIAWRDGASLRRTPGFFALESLAGDAPAQAAFWVAALACGETSLDAGARARYAAASGGGRLPDVTSLDFKKQNPGERTSPLFIASYVGLPRETVYALVGAMADAAR